MAAAALLATTACGSGSSDNAASGGGSDTVTVWHYFSDDSQVALMKKYADKFEAEHPGAKVDNVYVPYDQLDSKLISAAGAGKGPDVVVFNGADASTLALGGALAPMDDEWSSFADADKFPDAVLHKVDDKMYAAQGYVNLLGLWYNADILKKIGVQPPATMDELEADMAKAKAAGFGGITLSGLPNSQGEWQGYPWLSADGFTYDHPDESALTAGLERVGNWVKQGWLPQEAATWDQTVPFDKFNSGTFAFAANGNWQQGSAKANAKFKYGVVPLPLGDSGQVYLGGEGEGIGANSQNKKLAWEYLESTYFSADGQALAPTLVGSIPSRTDVSSSKAVTSNPLLAPFADTIAKLGAKYPSDAIPAPAVADQQTLMGQAWSSVIGEQSSPADAAKKAISSLTGLINQ